MTEMLKKEFSRKSFVKGGGAMIVGISVVGAGVAGKAQGAIDPYASPGPANPNSVDSFLIVHADNTVSLKSGRIELGQGSTTALRTIVAEELDMDTNQLRHISFDTGGVTPAPNTGNTGGSTSISQGGPLVRRAAVEAKIALLSLASTNLGVPVSGLSVSKGVVSGGGKTVTYGQLVGGQALQRQLHDDDAQRRRLRPRSRSAPTRRSAWHACRATTSRRSSAACTPTP